MEIKFKCGLVQPAHSLVNKNKEKLRVHLMHTGTPSASGLSDCLLFTVLLVTMNLENIAVLSCVSREFNKSLNTVQLKLVSHTVRQLVE